MFATDGDLALASNDNAGTKYKLNFPQGECESEAEKRFFLLLRGYIETSST
jgi:hypothetical protein